MTVPQNSISIRTLRELGNHPVHSPASKTSSDNGHHHLHPAITSADRESLVTAGRSKAAVSQAEADAWNRVLSALLLGGGIGAGARSLMGARNMLSKRPEVDIQSSIPTNIPVTIPRPPEKAAGLGARADGGVNWWEYPTGVGGAAAGLYGGWKLVDWLMNERRKRQLKSDLDTSRGSYEKAIQEQLNLANFSKSASLDSVYDAYNETVAGQIKESLDIARGVQDVAHGSLGAYLTALAATTGLSGVGAYEWVRSRSKAKALEEAIKARRQQRSAPQPVTAYPQLAPPPHK
jgi:hypothetical protein